MASFDASSFVIEFSYSLVMRSLFHLDLLGSYVCHGKTFYHKNQVTTLVGRFESEVYRPWLLY